MPKCSAYNRSDRVANEIFRVISEAVFIELSDPRLLNATVTRVQMARDLKTAKIYFHLPNGDRSSEKDVIAGFGSAVGFLKKRINRELDLRYIPDMKFFYDESVDLREKIESLSNRSDEDGR